MDDTKFFLIISVLLASCASNYSQKKLIGDYSSKGKDYAYELKLASDNTFQLTTRQVEVKSGCAGTWRVIQNDTLLLKCYEPKPYEMLQGGYMSEREKKIVLVGNQKLKIGEIILKTVKK
jgi:hypothetical protein